MVSLVPVDYNVAVEDVEPYMDDLCASLRHRRHWISGFMTFITVGLLITNIVFVSLEGVESPALKGLFPSVLVAYVIYLIECCYYAYKKLSNKVSVEEAYNVIGKILATQEVGIRWTFTCYHYETRYRTVYTTRTDSSGRTYQESHEEAYRVRVVSLTGTELFKHNSAITDHSKRLINLERYPVTMVQLSKTFLMGEALQNEKKHQFEAYKNYYSTLDSHLDTSTQEFIEGYLGNLFVSSLSGVAKFYASRWLFALVSLILLSWPIRVYFDVKYAHADVDIVKQFGDVNPTQS